MSSKKTSSNAVNDDPPPKSSILSTSAGGALLQIGVQISSRALTFIANQILLRYISPEKLGRSAQFEAYSTLLLSVARESLRVAIQRQSDIPDPQGSQPEREKLPKDHVDGRTSAGRTQALINSSYLSIFTGFVFSAGWIYYSRVRSRDPGNLETPYFEVASNIYASAALLELLSEPFFVIVQQKSRYEIRASAEATSTVLKCLVTCGSTYWAVRRNWDLGVLPFAFGQVAYALLLGVVYFRSVFRDVVPGNRFSPLLTRIYSSDSKDYLVSYFYWPLIKLISILFAQGTLKQILTQGDTIIIAFLASTTDQGIYALVSNYGGLIARLVFQPIEEMSRNYFGKQLSSSTSPPSKAAVEEARSNLQSTLRAYLLFSVCVLALGPTLAPPLLKIIVGKSWSSAGAGEVLGTFCYYIPLLAINGITEAFVSSVATEDEFKSQSAWMLAFSAAFVGAAIFFLRFLKMGAQGLVWANVFNMTFRVIWSTSFITAWSSRNGTKLEYRDLMPKPLTVAAAVGTAATIRQLEFTGGTADILKAGLVVGGFGILVGYSERQYLMKYFMICYKFLVKTKV